MKVFVVLCLLIVVVNSAPITWKMVDLTYPFDENAAKYPIFKKFKFEVTVNETMPNGVWIQSEEYASTTHAGTHMDAPSHFVPQGTSIDQIPLDRFIGPAAVIDIVQRAAADPDSGVTVEDLTLWEEMAGRSLDGTIVFMRSGWGSRYRNVTAYYGTPDNDVSKLRFPGFSAEAARWLVENRKIRGTGVDTLSLDKVTSEEYSGSTRAGTHIDSPSHFYPGTASVDQLSLDTLIGPAAVIDITSRAAMDPDAEMTVQDLADWEKVTGKTLDGTIVLMRSGWSAKYSNKTAYFGTPEDDSRKLHFPGFSPESAKWLVENRKIKGTGVDTLSLDRGSSIDYQSHKILSKAGIYIMENVANLENIPICGATVYVMPMKIAGTSGAPVRIIATYPE